MREPNPKENFQRKGGISVFFKRWVETPAWLKYDEDGQIEGRILQIY
jgi:hypothetical protein